MDKWCYFIYACEQFRHLIPCPESPSSVPLRKLVLTAGIEPERQSSVPICLIPLTQASKKWLFLYIPPKPLA